MTVEGTSTAASPALADETFETEAPSPREVRRRRALGHYGFLLGGAVVLAATVIAVFAPYIAPFDPFDQDLTRRLINPIWGAGGGWTHVFGTDALEKAGEDLETIMERRQKKDAPITDPVVANIVRCQGIDKARSYTRFKEGKWTTIDGNPPEAAKILKRLGDQALKVFDPYTVENTKQLAEKHAQAK